MIKNSKFKLIILGGSLISSSALALSTPPTAANNSVYISGDVGYGVLATPDKYLIEPDGVIITKASRRNGSVAGGASLGFNHAFTPHILAGTEFGYDYNGQAKYTETAANNASLTAKINSQDLHLLLTSTYLFSNGLNIFGKAGGAYIKQTLDASGNDAGKYDTNIKAFQPMLAAGTGYQFDVGNNDMVNIYVQYSHIFGSNPKNFSDLFTDEGTFYNTVSVDTIKLGAAVSIRI